MSEQKRLMQCSMNGRFAIVEAFRRTIRWFRADQNAAASSSFTDFDSRTLAA
ncbi:hypothetical protein [Ahniella affigens]|uniref:hypothetical protein n=1 Tax=Ahniella affigens TaxID=2021234 RepID=UPI00147469B8|nr:hypothetical protein [Ahniella affigens]